MNLTTRPSDNHPSLYCTDHGGSGPTLLLLHGVTRCGGDWEPVVAALKASWRVLALDQRGHGRSARAERYLVNDYVDDAVRFVRDEVAAPLAIFGHSLGAMVAAAVAAQLPQQVLGVVLEDPPFHTMGNRIAGSTWQAVFRGMQAAIEQRGSIQEITRLLADIRLPSSVGGTQRLGDVRDLASLAWSAECLHQLDPEVLTCVIEGRWLDGYDTRDILARIRCPAMLLQADPAAGGALTDADAEAAVAALPDSQHIRFPNAGHQLHRDNTQAVLQALQPLAGIISPISN